MATHTSFSRCSDPGESAPFTSPPWAGLDLVCGLWALAGWVPRAAGNDGRGGINQQRRQRAPAAARVRCAARSPRGPGRATPHRTRQRAWAMTPRALLSRRADVLGVLLGHACMQCKYVSCLTKPSWHAMSVRLGNTGLRLASAFKIHCTRVSAMPICHGSISTKKRIIVQSNFERRLVALARRLKEILSSPPLE